MDQVLGVLCFSPPYSEILEISSADKWLLYWKRGGCFSKETITTRTEEGKGQSDMLKMKWNPNEMWQNLKFLVICSSLCGFTWRKRATRASKKPEVGTKGRLKVWVPYRTGPYWILMDIWSFLMTKVPHVVRELLRYGPKHPCRSQFQGERFLANMNLLLEKCVKEDLSRDAINKINSLTVGYVASCKRRIVDKKVKITKEWLKDQGTLAVPYDKGTGFCLMKRETCNEKVKKLLDGPQFRPIAPRKKDRLFFLHPALKLSLTNLHRNICQPIHLLWYNIAYMSPGLICNHQLHDDLAITLYKFTSSQYVWL